MVINWAALIPSARLTCYTRLREENMRQTGKTFRKLMQSLNAASEGKNVIYECSNVEMARWTFDKAVDVVAAFMGKPEVPEPFVLKIGNGTVRFSGPFRSFESRHLARRADDFVFVYDTV